MDTRRQGQRLSFLIGLILLSACALTLKQSVYHANLAWVEVREEALTAYAKGTVSDQDMVLFLEADKAFVEVYERVKVALLKGEDIAGKDLDFLWEMIEVWRGKIRKA